MNDGVAGTQKDALKQALSGVQTSITQSYSNGESDDLCKEIAFEELDMLIGQVQGITSYKALNLSNSLSKTEKKILEKVFDVISGNYGNIAEDMIDKIIAAFNEDLK